MKLTLSEALPPSVIAFGKPLMTPDLDPNSDATLFCQAKVKSSQEKVKSQRKKSREREKDLTLLTLLSLLHHHPPPP